MDPSVLLRAYRPMQWPDPVEEYGRFMSLRQMADMARYRQAQMKQEELQNQQIQRDISDYERFRQEAPGIDWNNPNTPGMLSSRYGKYGIAALKSIQDAAEATSKAQTQALTRTKTEEDLTKSREQEMAKAQLAMLLERDPARREEIDRGNKQEFLNRGWITPDQARLPAPTPQQHAAIFLRNWGPDAYQKWLHAEAKEAREEALHPYQSRKAVAEATTAEQKAFGEPEMPAEERTFRNVWLAGWLSMNRLPNTPENVARAYEAFEKTKTPRIAIPGTDVPLPPEVQKQREEMARNIAANKPQNAAVFKNKSLSLKNLEDTIQEYKTELETTGPTFRPEKGARLKALYTNLQMATKNLFELGVITGPDMQILQGAIADPTGIQGNWLGTSALLKQLEVMKSVVERSKNNLAEVYGNTATPARPPAAPETGKKKRRVFNAQTGEFEEK